MHTHPGLVDGPVYLDYNATTPTDPRVVEAVLPYLTTHFGNPSSGHRYGAASADAVAQVRERVAQLIGARPPGGDRVCRQRLGGQQRGHPRLRPLGAAADLAAADLAAGEPERQC